MLTYCWQLFSRRRVLWEKHWKWVLCYNFTPGGRIFIKLGRNVLFDDTYAVSKPKFEIRKFSTFYRGDIVVTTNGGGVLYRTLAGMIGHDRKKDFSIFFFHNQGKRKTRTYPKEFLKNIKKNRSKINFSQPCGTTPPPPIRTQTINGLSINVLI